jgi:hypothetical protein
MGKGQAICQCPSLLQFRQYGGLPTGDWSNFSAIIEVQEHWGWENRQSNTSETRDVGVRKKARKVKR